MPLELFLRMACVYSFRVPVSPCLPTFLDTWLAFRPRARISLLATADGFTMLGITLLRSLVDRGAVMPCAVMVAIAAPTWLNAIPDDAARGATDDRDDARSCIRMSPDPTVAIISSIMEVDRWVAFDAFVVDP